MMTIFDMTEGAQRTEPQRREMAKVRIDDPRLDGIVALGLQPIVTSRPQVRNVSVFSRCLRKS